MAQPPPRPAPPRMGGAPSPGAPSPSSAAYSSGTRTKESESKSGAQTFFVGRYRVVDEIGVGGMASVHLGRMDGPGGFQKWVAIKRIHPHLVEDDQFVDMFLDEARIAAGISHANVAQVFDLGKDDNTYWIAMEYLHGEPLREVMRRAEERNLRISPDLAARICADAAEGLHAAHELRGKNGQLLGLVHRDVTPHNLFVTYDGYTKVVDFGIAMAADRLSSTRAGTLKGKLAYMSPEQVRGAEVDRTTDIFALGVVLWELTTNQRLFRMDTDLDTLEKVKECIVPPPSTIVADYPVELESVVMKALAMRKQDRYQTAREFSRALQTYLVRRGAFVGPEEVAQFVRHVFADRIPKREAHLAWAAEVTGSVNVDKLRSKQAMASFTDEVSVVEEVDDKPGTYRPAQQPATMTSSGARPVQEPKQQMPAMSLLDDDEDVPTTVASRDQIEGMNAVMASIPSMALADRAPVRPAAGMPASAANPGYGGPGQHGYPGVGAPFGGAPPHGDGRAVGVGGMYGVPGDDLGATVALPNSRKQQEQSQQQQPRPGGPQQQFPMHGAGGYGQPEVRYGQPQQPGFGPSAFGQAQMSPYPGAAGGPAGIQRQSHIETAVSLPRPDPAAVWLAQQAVAQRGQRKNPGVLIAVVALTALCVIGIAALLYYKLKLAAPPAQPKTSLEVSPAPSLLPTRIAAGASPARSWAWASAGDAFGQMEETSRIVIFERFSA